MRILKYLEMKIALWILKLAMKVELMGTGITTTTYTIKEDEHEHQ